MCHYVMVCHGQGVMTFNDHDDGDGIRICFNYFVVVLSSVLGHFSGVFFFSPLYPSASVPSCIYVTTPKHPCILL